jgi:hypothetical protein
MNYDKISIQVCFKKVLGGSIMRKILLLLMLSFTIVLTGCKDNDTDDTIEVGAIILLNGNEFTMNVGDSQVIQYEVRPGDANNQELSCITDDSSIATCSNFRIYANGVGSTIITLEASNGVDTEIEIIIVE